MRWLCVLPLLAVLASAQQTALQLGANLPPGVARRVEQLLRQASPWPVVLLDPLVLVTELPQGSLLLALGDTATTRVVISAAELAGVGAEGYVVRSSRSAVGGATVLAGDGNAMARSTFRYGAASIGAAYAAYAALEELGFAFLHAFAPLVPTPSTWAGVPAQGVDRAASPRWETRLWHIHTQHPLELTDMLNGLDIAGPQYNATFDEMLPEFERMLEWLLANQQNRLEWILLMSPAWRDGFGYSDLRKARLRTLVALCHEYAMPCAADVPIALVQQHSWTMIGRPQQGDDWRVNMHSNIDWWMDCGFDFITTENGFTEFTPANCTTMLEWINEATSYLADVYGRELHIKVHISTGQTCDEFPDPITGLPINFNFLPIYADRRLGILPHTVQVYSYDEPAPTYGNDNFTAMYEFMFQQAQAQEREVAFYPETCYWVNYDTQVPLFLPIYAYNRFRDLRYIARREASMTNGAHVHGQSIFESGWEWGYWLGNVVAARAVYDPRLDIADEDEAFLAIVRSALRVFGGATDAVAKILLDLSKVQKQLLVEGKIDGVTPPDNIDKRNGMAYLEGWDTFADIGALFESFLATQPRRINLIEFRRELNVEPNYRTLVSPLLARMESEFARFAGALEDVAAAVARPALPLYEEFVQSTQMLAIRSAHVFALYDYASTWRQGNTTERAQRLLTAQQAMITAEQIIRTREAAYRTPALRIAAWRPNPTVYDYTYLWQVKSMYYFWRDFDQAVAESRKVYSPCYMNYCSPAKIAFGDGQLETLLDAIRRWADETRPGPHVLVDCIAAPATEPVYPLSP